MAKDNLLEEIDRLIKGKKVVNPAAENNDPELAKQIVSDMIVTDLEKRKIFRTEVEQEKFSKVIVNYYGKKDLAKQIIDIKPIYYDEAKNWWVWDSANYRWRLIDETAILNFVSHLANYNTVATKERVEILEALKQESRKKKPKEIKNTWLQFVDTIYELDTGNEFGASSEYFVTNPIPYKLNEDNFIDTPNMDRVFAEWVGEDYVKTLYEILAYCLLPDYPLHRLFCFIGEGMNGKSCFLRLLKKFIGSENVTATELDTLISSRFEVTRLHKKLACIMGETNFSEMSKTSIIKKLTGQDTIGFEYKNKTPFDDVNYAKILIATNNLPTTTDKTIGFYRRWLIIDFPNKFSEQKDILGEIPEAEYECLARKCCFILKDLLDKRAFSNEGSIEDRAKKYEDHSDPLEKFIKEFTEEDGNSYIWKFEFEKKLNEWCKENRFRTMSEVIIGKKMKERGVESIQRESTWLMDGMYKKLRAWAGIKWKGEKSQVEQE